MPIKAAVPETAPHGTSARDASSPRSAEPYPPDLTGTFKSDSEVAADIDRLFADSAYWAIVRDLRIDHQGGTVSIDHLIVNRNLEMFVCTSKGFGDGLSIDEDGAFGVYEGLATRPIPSPIDANRTRIAALRDLLARGGIPLPARDGKPVEPLVSALVLLPRRARVSRPKTLIVGIESIAKTDQLDAWLQRHLERQERSVATRVTVDRATLDTIVAQIVLQGISTPEPSTGPADSFRPARARRKSRAGAA